jgi:hypothetical protein
MRSESRIFHTNPLVSHKSKNMRHKVGCLYFHETQSRNQFKSNELKIGIQL